jgi:anti-sigma factor RsiW
VPSRSVTYQDLLAYAAGELSGEEAARVHKHLRTAPAGAETVRLYQTARHSLATDDSVAPPEAVATRAKSLFDRSRVAAAESLLDRAGAIVASLLFDSRLQPAAVRATTSSNRIQLAYEASAVDIDLVAEPAAEAGNGAAATTWRLMGQAATEDGCDGTTVALIPAGATQPLMKTQTDEHGAFVFSDVPSGRYQLHLQLEMTILVPTFELQ